jgi:hypothetical protein
MKRADEYLEAIEYGALLGCPDGADLDDFHGLGGQAAVICAGRLQVDHQDLPACAYTHVLLWRDRPFNSVKLCEKNNSFYPKVPPSFTSH